MNITTTVLSYSGYQRSDGEIFSNQVGKNMTIEDDIYMGYDVMSNRSVSNSSLQGVGAASTPAVVSLSLLFCFVGK